MYKKIYEQGRGQENKHLIHLWTDEGYEKIEWNNYAYRECRPEEAEFTGLKGEPLLRTHDWDRKTPKLHFGDISAHQKFLIEKYGTNDETSKTCREVFLILSVKWVGHLQKNIFQMPPNL
jgi:hypothetical protein